jgi:peroxiredoxin
MNYEIGVLAMIRFFGLVMACIVAFGLMVMMMNLMPTCKAITITTQQTNSMNNIPTQESPFACNTSVYTPSQKTRKDELDNQFRKLAISYRELPNGYAFEFPSDEISYETIAEWFAMERLCCPFFSMDLELERENGSVWLNLTGREGTKRFIEADFQSMKRLHKAQAVNTSKVSAKESPFACNTAVYTDPQKVRKEIVGKEFRRLARAPRELPNGYAVEYATDVDSIKNIAEWIVLERLCCPFLSFGLIAEREGGSVSLSLTGREGVKRFISAEFQPVLSQSPIQKISSTSQTDQATGAELAPDLDLVQVGGGRFHLRNLRGRVVVLNFWATWCVPCRVEIPDLNKLNQDLHDQGVAIVGVSWDDSAKQIQMFQKQIKMNYPVVLGGEPMQSKFGGVPSVPTTFIIDRAGRIRQKMVGVTERSEIETTIKSLLAE